MRSITMTGLHHDSFDGVNVVTLEPGKTYEVPDQDAGRYISMGIALPAKLAVEGDVETKDAGAAEENKAAVEANGTETETTETETEPEPVPTVEELLKLNRKQLDEIATANSVDSADLPNKQAVAEAILAAIAANASSDPETED